MHLLLAMPLSLAKIIPKEKAIREAKEEETSEAEGAETTSANGNKYFMTFVDDYSRMCWIYCLKTKSEAFQTDTSY